MFSILVEILRFIANGEREFIKLFAAAYTNSNSSRRN
jgi:hypothetical protein